MKKIISILVAAAMLLSLTVCGGTVNVTGGTLTGNCTITSLTNNGKINFNAYTITLADGTVLK